MGDEDGKQPQGSPKGTPDLFEDIEAAPHPDAPDPSDQPSAPAIDIETDASVGIPSLGEGAAEAPKLSFPDIDEEAEIAAATPPGMPPLEDLLQAESDPEPEPEPEPDIPITPELGAGRQRFAFAEDDLEALERDEETGIESRTLMIIGGVVVTIFVILLGYLYFSGGETPSDQDVPLVEAPEGPAKIEPEDRGGMEVADQDKLVFDRVADEETALREILAAGPEEPVALPEALPEAEALPAGEPIVTDATKTTESKETSDTIDNTIDKIAAVLAEETSAQTPKAVPAPKPERSQQPAALSGDYFVQLGAYGSRDSAMSAWRTVSSRFSDILGGSGERIEAVDPVAQSTLYRLQAGPFATKSEADVTCRALKAAGRDCLVVRRR